MNLWEVDFGLNGIIKIVCEHVEPDIRDDLCIGKVRSARGSPTIGPPQLSCSQNPRRTQSDHRYFAERTDHDVG